MISFKHLRQLFFVSLLLFISSNIAIAQAPSSLTQYRLPPPISSSAVDYAPSISADGKTLLLQSNRFGKYEIFIVQKNDDGSWGTPWPIEAVNNYGSEYDLVGGPTISYDGNRIYFFASFKGRVSVEDIYYSQRTAEGWSMPIYASTNINTRDYDGFPSLSSDGKSLYFVRKAAQAVVDNEFCTQILVSTRQANGEWSRGVALPANINMGCEKYPRILSDNETLIFSRKKAGVTAGFDIYITRKLTESTWSEPKPITYLNTPTNDIFASVPASGDIIYFNNKLNDNFDLYAAPLPKEYQPKKVIVIQGFVKDEEGDPPLEASFDIIRDGKSQNNNSLRSNKDDGKYTLVLVEGYKYKVVITSKGYEPIEQEFDMSTEHEYKLVEQNIPLVKIRRKFTLEVRNKETNALLDATVEKTGKPFTELSNDSLGYYSIAMEYGDAHSFTVSKEGYLPVKGKMILDDKHIDDNHQVIYLAVGIPKLNITVTDAETGLSISPRLTILKNNGRQNMFNNVINGSYESDLEYDQNYNYRLRLKGYFFVQDTLDLKGVFTGRNVVLDIKMVPLKVGNKLTLNSVNFEVNSAKLDEDSKAILNEVAFLLRSNRRLVVEVGAHTDDVGDNDFNLDLSNRRAESVKAYLIANDVAERALKPKGYGEKSPIVENDSDENKAINRRVEFIILSI